MENLTSMEISKLPLLNVVALINFFQTQNFGAFLESSKGGVFLSVLDKSPTPEWLSA